jgi:tetratricopeptide (TPR) repeat protein
LLIVLFFIVIVITIFQSLTERAISIRPISVPKNLTDNGFTPEVASQRLRDALTAYIKNAQTDRMHILLGDDRPDIVVPTVGLSVETISSWIRTFLGVERRHEISGEITFTSEKLWLRLRLKNQEFYTSSAGVDLEKPDKLFAEAAPAIFGYLDPLLAAIGQFTAGNWQQALEGAQLIVEESPNADEKVLSAYILKGASFAQMKEYENAIEVLNFATHLAAHLQLKSPAVHSVLGDVLLKQGKLDEAVSEFRKAIALDPNNDGYHSSLGFALRAQGKLDEAASECRQAIALDPKDPGNHNVLAAVLFKQGKVDAGVIVLRHAVTVDPRADRAHYNLGTGLIAAGKQDDAITEYREAIRINPKFVSAYHNLTVVLIRQGKLEDAIAVARQAVAADQNSAKAHDNLGVILRRQGKLDDAMAELSRAVALDSKSANAHDNLGVVLAERGKLDDAMAEYRMAIALDPQFALAHDNLGAVLARQNKLDEAISEFRKAIELDPKLAWPHYHLDTVLNSLGKSFDAVDEHNKAVALGAQDSGAPAIDWELD